ncbi:ParA family protein [Elusimicrobiota bacterium]
MRIIAVSNQKGGSGKTTTAINLCAALARIGKKVLLIDMDPQSHASVGLNINTAALAKSIYHVLVSKENTGIDEVIVPVAENFDIAPSEIELSGAELELASEIGREARLSHAISKMTRRYDYVVIDCPPSLGLLTFNSLVACKEILVAVEMSFFALHGVGKLLQLVSIIRERLNHPIEVRALATIYDRRNKISQEILDNLRTNFKDKALKSVININVKLKEAASKGAHIFDYAPDSRGAQDYMELAKEIISQEGHARETPGSDAVTGSVPEPESEPEPGSDRCLQAA